MNGFQGVLMVSQLLGNLRFRLDSLNRKPVGGNENSGVIEKSCGLL